MTNSFNKGSQITMYIGECWLFIISAKNSEGLVMLKCNGNGFIVHFTKGIHIEFTT